MDTGWQAFTKTRNQPVKYSPPRALVEPRRHEKTNEINKSRPKDVTLAQLNENLGKFGNNSSSPKFHLPRGSLTSDLRESSPILSGISQHAECLVHYEPHSDENEYMDMEQAKSELESIRTTRDHVTTDTNQNTKSFKHAHSVSDLGYGSVRQGNSLCSCSLKTRSKSQEEERDNICVKCLSQLNIRDLNKQESLELMQALILKLYQENLKAKPTSDSREQGQTSAPQKPSEPYLHKWFEKEKRKFSVRHLDEQSLCSENMSVTSVEVASIFNSGESESDSTLQRRKLPFPSNRLNKTSVQPQHVPAMKRPQPLSLENFVEQSFASFMNPADLKSKAESKQNPDLTRNVFCDSGITVSTFREGDETPTPQNSPPPIATHTTCVPSMHHLMGATKLLPVTMSKTSDQKFGIRVLYTAFREDVNPSGSEPEPSRFSVLHVRHLAEDGVAVTDGSIVEGDYLIEVNGKSVQGLEEEEVNDLLEESDSLNLVVARRKDYNTMDKACDPIPEFLPTVLMDETQNRTLVNVIQNYERLRRRLHQKEETIQQLQDLLSCHAPQDSGIGSDIYTSSSDTNV